MWIQSTEPKAAVNKSKKKTHAEPNAAVNKGKKGPMRSQRQPSMKEKTRHCPKPKVFVSRGRKRCATESKATIIRGRKIDTGRSKGLLSGLCQCRQKMMPDGTKSIRQ